MRIEIWSDVVCPWCYIGKRRLETALSTFEHADQVEVVWRSYQLDPAAPSERSITSAEALSAKLQLGPDQLREMISQVRSVAAQEGLEFTGDTFLANTADAHRVLHLALAEGGPSLQGDVKEALLAAHFVDGLYLGDHDVLTARATRAGLDEQRVREVLSGDEFADAVSFDIEEARSLGSTGVPFFVIDRKYGVSGAQTVETFTEVLSTAWADAHPAVTVLGSGETVCGPDGCPV